MIDWRDVMEGPKWVPILNDAETNWGIPKDLLARIAYEESHFIPAIIEGTRESAAGALGLMQLEPRFFATVRVPLPFTDSDTDAQIEEAAKFLSGLYASTKSWPLAIAAYNAGLSEVEKYAGIPPFEETEKYVRDILADVPSVGETNA